VLLMNIMVKPFDDLKVRQAIAYGRRSTAAHRPGDARVCLAVVLAGAGGVCRRDDRRTHIEHDLSKAKQLLSDAGYPNGLDVTMNVYDTQKLRSDVVAEQLKQAGIRVMKRC